MVLQRNIFSPLPSRRLRKVRYLLLSPAKIHLVIPLCHSQGYSLHFWGFAIQCFKKLVDKLVLFVQLIVSGVKHTEKG